MRGGGRYRACLTPLGMGGRPSGGRTLAVRRTGTRAAGVVLGLGLLAGAVALAQDTAPSRDGVVFRHAVDDGPLDVSLRPGEPATEAVKRFQASGQNVYVGQPGAVGEGKQQYETWCQSCHLADGSGRIGPSLIDDVYNYKRTRTDIGMFEIILGGGAGAMQPFRDRLTQDQILKVIAYVHSLKR